MEYKIDSVAMEYQNVIPKILQAYNKFFEIDQDETIKKIKTVTFQVTEDCNLCCTYCYQINKAKNTMPFETAKKFIDLLIEDSYKEHTYFSITKTRGIVCEFIGGEPLLEIELIDQITDYFRNRLIELRHPWVSYFRISMISNGVLYFDEKVQNYLEKNKRIVSFGISLDGCKELHDACRVFNSGEGSYDIASAAAVDYMKRYDPDMSTKMTFAPENIEYAYDAIVNLVNLGYKTIQCNPIYEDKWNNEHPKIYYQQLKKIADYVLNNKLYEYLFIRAFDVHAGFANDLENHNENYCGSTGHMLACDYRGDIYPCIRFMKSSLGTDVVPFKIGDVNNGINITLPDQERVNILNSIKITTQSDDECINCPIATSCGWCTALNYQTFGTPDKRLKSICGMHKARILANVYYWNQVYLKGGYSNDAYEMRVPKEWALEIIDEDEYNMLLGLVDDLKASREEGNALQ